MADRTLRKTVFIGAGGLLLALAVAAGLFLYGRVGYAGHIVPAATHNACFGCHDGSVAGVVNVVTDFTKTSHHPYVSMDATTTCGPCHNSNGVADTSGTIYPKLLTSVDTATGIPSYSGNAFCGSCHGVGSGQIGGDHLSGFTGTKHDLQTTGTASGSGVKCVSCHNQHGSNFRPMLRETVQETSITGDNNSVCLACHTTTLGGFAGAAAYNQTPHSSSTIPGAVWPVAADAGLAVGGPAAGNCTNCHNPHGKTDAQGQIPKYNLRREENLCYGAGAGCHSSAANSESGINIQARFTANADNRTHHNVATADQTATGSKVECTNCHNTHTNTRAYKNADPDNPAVNFTTQVNDITLYPKAPIQPAAEGKDAVLWWANVNPGSEPDLDVGRKWGDIARSLIEFDLSSVPTDAVVTQATLSLPEIVPDADLGNDVSSEMTVQLHRNTSAWTESNVTVATAPSIDGTVIATTGAQGTVGWRDLGVTSLVQGWIDGSYPNYGVTIKAPLSVETGGAEYWRRFRSSDYVAGLVEPAVARPKLTIQYVASEPPKVADHITFCGKCHDGAPPAGVTVPASVRQIVPNYTNAGDTADFHGGRASAGPASGSGLGYLDDLAAPYFFGAPPLRCSDCHDTHGSSNAYAIKETVNGKTGIRVPLNIDGTNYEQVRQFCGACHSFTHVQGYNCFGCHYHGANYDRINGVPGKNNAYF